MKFLSNKQINSDEHKSRLRPFKCDPEQVLHFLSHCPRHASTPVIDCASLASQNKLHKVWVKDESSRMGLGSFKALGGIYAVARILQNAATSHFGRKVSSAELLQPEIQHFASKIRFVTASAGNHGISVATGAKLFGAQATIVLSHSVPREFADRLRQVPCSVAWHGNNYEQSVTHAVELSKEPGRILLADGSWDGYTELPAMVMEGYSVIPEECMNYFTAIDAWPTHIFLQAGVGGLAASFTEHVRRFWPVQPVMTVVEPEAAPCLMESARQGCLTAVEGPVSVMGRLDCKQASLLAFNALLESADAFVMISDEESVAGIESARSVGVSTTESGAAGLTALLIACSSSAMRSEIALHPQSRCLVVISEKG